jgi:hypothetical protein
MKAKSFFFALSMVILTIVAQPSLVTPTAAQGSGCYKPCLNTYRRCQRAAGRYNRKCRQRLGRCWRECDRAVGMGHNPMPRP